MPTDNLIDRAPRDGSTVVVTDREGVEAEACWTDDEAFTADDRGSLRHAAHPVIRSLIRVARAAMSNGLVRTCMPRSRCPWLRTAFSA